MIVCLFIFFLFDAFLLKGWGHPRQPERQVDGLSKLKPNDAAVERILKMEPKVECTGDSMKLHVQDSDSTPGSLFFVDRGEYQSPRTHSFTSVVFTQDLKYVQSSSIYIF